MFGLLLAIIYISFISLGLPDALLGSAWPTMYTELNASVTGAGTIAMIISLGTIVSSLNADRLITKFSTGKVTAVSVGITALALFGFSISKQYWHLMLWAIPYGLGAGAVDSALNNYVALHYSSRHMSWLHCMWGIGASTGPYIMSLALTNQWGWSRGYQLIGILQVVLTAILFLTLPLWKSGESEQEETHQALSIKDAVKLKGAKPIMIAFLCYCGLEASTGLWASSYLVQIRNIDATTAASYASLFYLGITIGRLISGFISEKLGDQNMIRLGQCIGIVGLVLLFIPVNQVALIGLVMIGLGCAPIYPSIIHSTPDRFGKENSQALTGLQMASAYVGSTLMPKLFGIIADFVSLNVYPIYLIIMMIVMFVMTEKAKIKKENN